MATASGSGTGPGRSHTSKVAQTAPLFFICNHHRYRISTLSTLSRDSGHQGRNKGNQRDTDGENRENVVEGGRGENKEEYEKRFGK